MVEKHTLAYGLRSPCLDVLAGIKIPSAGPRLAGSRKRRPLTVRTTLGEAFPNDLLKLVPFNGVETVLKLFNRTFKGGNLLGCCWHVSVEPVPDDG